MPKNKETADGLGVRSAPTVTCEGVGVLDDLREWWGRYVLPLEETSLDLLTLWTVHTHLIEHLWSSPRCEITSPLPESGKTTVIEHMGQLCANPLSTSSGMSSALMGRTLAKGPRTFLLDEAHRNLDPNKEGVLDLLAFMNGGYKRGATRPTLIPTKGDWEVVELPMFCAFVWAGVNAAIPDDTRSRTLVVDMLPDLKGQIQDSDWQVIEPEARLLKQRLTDWATKVGEHVAANKVPTLPAGVTGRSKEKWRPLKRVADAAGGRWPEVCSQLAAADVARLKDERESGMMREHPALNMVRDMAAEWPLGFDHWSTDQIAEALAAAHPDRWGPDERFKSGLTVQRIGRYLGRQFKIHPVRDGNGDRIGYSFEDLTAVWERLNIEPPGVSPVTVGSDVTVKPTAAERFSGNGSKRKKPPLNNEAIMRKMGALK